MCDVEEGREQQGLKMELHITWALLQLDMASTNWLHSAASQLLRNTHKQSLGQSLSLLFQQAHDMVQHVMALQSFTQLIAVWLLHSRMYKVS